MGDQSQSRQPGLVQLDSLTATASGASVAARPAGDGSAVILRNLTKRYGSERVVDDVSAHVAAGEFFSILGPSGSGKTTTLMMVAGFVAADAGSIEVAGRDLSRVPPQRRGFGMVFQNYAIFPHLNVFENVAFPLRARGMRRAEIAERVAWALDMVRLARFGDRFSRALSGGQQQRVAIARAIVFHPRVVLMDEPLGALDKNLRTEMQAEIRDIQQRLGTTVIYVTHDQEEALAMSDRIAIMDQGRVAQIGDPRTVYERPDTAFVATFLGEANLIDGTVERVDGNEALFRAADGATFRAPAASVVPGPARLFVRPEKLTLSAGGENRANGTVLRTAFLGSRMRLDLQTPGGARLTLDLPNAGGVRAPAPGEAVSVAWPVSDTRILPA